MRRPATSRAETLLLDLLQLADFHDAAEQPREVLDDIVERHDTDEAACVVDDRQPPNARAAHLLERDADLVRVGHDDEAPRHDLAGRHVARIVASGHHLDHQVAVGNQTNRNGFAIAVLDHDDVADMRVPHAIGQFKRTAFGGARFDRLGADSSDVHDNAPVALCMDDACAPPRGDTCFPSSG
ncbi:hypothetical protein BLAT2472_20366 [Burkholderia latens]